MVQTTSIFISYDVDCVLTHVITHVQYNGSLPEVSINWNRCIYDIYYYDGFDDTGNSLIIGYDECEDNCIPDIYTWSDARCKLIGWSSVFFIIQVYS